MSDRPVHVYRGRAQTVDADREASAALFDHAADGERAVRVWRPHRQVAFGRRDRNESGYEAAKQAAGDRDFPPVERAVGGRAVAYDGETTMAFARAEPVADVRTGIQERYDAVTGALESALADLGIDVERGEPADAFCPGSHSLRLSGGVEGNDRGEGAGRCEGDDRVEGAGRCEGASRGKVAGIAQRVTADGALVAGILLVDNRPLLADVLAAVYGALGVPFDPDAVGTLAEGVSREERATVTASSDFEGRADLTPTRVRDAVENALVGDRPRSIVPVGDDEPP